MAAADAERNVEGFLLVELGEAVRQDLSNARKRKSEAPDSDGRRSSPGMIPDLEVGRMAGDSTKVFTDQNFEEEVLKSDRPVLVDFWAEWCAPCRMVAPAVEAIALEYDGRAKIGKLNVDENQSVMGRYNIRSIPTLLIFKNGQIQEQIVGATSKDRIAKLLQKHL